MGEPVLDDIDLASDEAWEPVWSPYHGKVVPSFMITREARFRMAVSDVLDKPNQ